MANTNIDLLYPEFWASAFYEYNKGQYPLKNRVNRQYEPLVSNFGDTVNVPITPDATAQTWTPGNAITPDNITQTTEQVILDKSVARPFNLNGTELSLSAYNLITQYGVPSVEAIMAQVDLDIYVEMLKTPNFTDGTATFNEDTVIDAGTALTNRKVSMQNRTFVGAPDEIGALMKVDAYQFVNQTGKTDVMHDGVLTNRMGFDFMQSNGISIYTPQDLVGTVTPALTGGETTVALGSFVDATTKVRAGDIIVFAGEAGTPKHTITSVSPATGNTTSITVFPAVVGVVADLSAATITPTRSGLAFVPSSTAFAARHYQVLPGGAGVASQVFMVEGLPIRVSVWHDAQLGITVQYDCLYGVKMIDGARIQRVIID